MGSVHEARVLPQVWANVVRDSLWSWLSVLWVLHEMETEWGAASLELRRIWRRR